jgi:hypothetical protein
VFSRAGGLEGQERLVGGAPVRERGERAAVRSPRADRGEQADAGLLREILALTALRQSELPHDALDERLKAAHEFLLGIAVTALRGVDQPPPGATGRAVSG